MDLPVYPRISHPVRELFLLAPQNGVREVRLVRNLSDVVFEEQDVAGLPCHLAHSQMPCARYTMEPMSAILQGKETRAQKHLFHFGTTVFVIFLRGPLGKHLVGGTDVHGHLEEGLVEEGHTGL